jgi:RND family efflux transporter MFP subunit
MKTIIKISLIVLISSFIAACGSSQKEESPAAKLETYKKQVNDLNKQIEDLEQGINATGKEAYTGIRIPVSTMVVKPEKFAHYFEATGELESIDEAYISPEVIGQIVTVLVKEGQIVKKGQVLARLNTLVIEKNMQEVKDQLNLAETIFNKQSALWDKNIGSERQFLEAKNNFESLKNKLETMKAQYDYYILKSPINGIVETISLKEGEMASPGLQFMHVVNIDELYVTAQISETYLPVIVKGEEVDITFPTFPGMQFTRPVYRTGNVINQENRTFLVQVKLDNPTGKLKPNMLANLEINDYTDPQALVIPSILIRNDLQGRFIYLAEKKDADMIAHKIYITTGKSYLDKTEVLSGLTAGDVLVNNGYNNVSDGVVINVLNN